MACVRSGGCEAVMTVKLDRLARSLSHFAQLIEEFDRYGVAFIATSQGIDTSKANPAGILQMHVLAAVAQFERSLIRDRTMAGLAAAKARGKVLGHPSAKLIGLDVKQIVQVWRSETNGFNVRLLAERLGGVSVLTAWRLAKANPA